MFKSDRLRKYRLALILFMGAAFATSNLKAKEEINYQGLPPGKGVELVAETCTACHSAGIILANQMSREAWDKTITWMQKEQGLWELDKADRKIILDYLSKVQGIGEIKAEPIRKKNNSMYEFDYRPNPL